MPKQVVNIQAPVGGIYKRRAFQSHPPFTTPDCDNVRVDDPIEGRERIGSRPGLVIQGTPSGSGAVTLLQSVRYVSLNLWVDKLFAVRGTTLFRSTDAAAWTSSGTVTALGTNVNQYMGADFHQSLYVAAGNGDFFTYNPSTDALDLAPTPTAGTIPQDAEIIIRYRDRLLLTGIEADPHNWYMSRSGDGLDWDETATDVLSAIKGSVSDAGQLGEPIRAAIPHGDDCVIFGCDSSIWTLRSDPNFGGTMDNLSQRVGIVDKHAWTRTPGGWLFFLTQDGIMAMQPGCGDVPISISRERIPEEMLQIDRETTIVNLEYDMRFRGIHVFLTPKTAGTNTHYWLDIKQLLTGDRENAATFWPMTFAGDLQAFSTYTFEGQELITTSISSALVGGRGGGVYAFDQSVDCEESSYVDIGPLSTTGKTGQYFNGSVDILNVVMADGSGTVTWEARSGESPEAAFDSSVEYTGTFPNTTNRHTIRLRMRNPYYMIKYKDTSNAEWAIESTTSVINPRGKQRFGR